MFEMVRLHRTQSNMEQPSLVNRESCQSDMYN